MSIIRDKGSKLLGSPVHTF